MYAYLLLIDNGCTYTQLFVCHDTRQQIILPTISPSHFSISYSRTFLQWGEGLKWSQCETLWQLFPHECCFYENQTIGVVMVFWWRQKGCLHSSQVTNGITEVLSNYRFVTLILYSNRKEVSGQWYRVIHTYCILNSQQTLIVRVLLNYDETKTISRIFNVISVNYCDQPSR